jgi:hypothetical protein
MRLIVMSRSPYDFKDDKTGEQVTGATVWAFYPDSIQTSGKARGVEPFKVSKAESELLGKAGAIYNVETTMRMYRGRAEMVISEAHYLEDVDLSFRGNGSHENTTGSSILEMARAAK